MSFKNRVIVYGIITIIVTAIAIKCTELFLVHHIHQQQHQAIIDKYNTLWQSTYKATEQSMTQQMGVVLENRALVQQLRKPNLVLLSGSKPIQQKLSAKKVSNYLIITDKEKKIVGAEPMAIKDAVLPPFLPDVFKKKSHIFGMMQTQKGDVVFALSFPIIQNGAIIGSATYIKNTHDIIPEVASLINTPVFLSDTSLHTLLDSSDKALWNATLPYRGTLSVPGLETVSVEKQPHYAVTIPILGYDNKPIAALLFMEDLGIPYAPELQIWFFSGASLLLILLAAGGIFYVCLSRTFTPSPTCRMHLYVYLMEQPVLKCLTISGKMKSVK